jgi:predicted DNA-binding protein (MmcQ/YjbR family)
MPLLPLDCVQAAVILPVMTLDQYNAFCAGLPHATHVVQWGGAHVWKVSSKVFAIAGWQERGRAPHITFKCSRLSFELLKEQKGCRPAPYLASRGLLWIQRTGKESLSDEDLKGYLRESHRLAAANLTRKLRQKLGLAQA